MEPQKEQDFDTAQHFAHAGLLCVSLLRLLLHSLIHPRLKGVGVWHKRRRMMRLSRMALTLSKTHMLALQILAYCALRRYD